MFKEIRLGMKVEAAILEELGENAAEYYVNQREEFEEEKKETTKMLIEAQKTIKKTGAISKDVYESFPEGVKSDLLPKVLLIK